MHLGQKQCIPDMMHNSRTAFWCINRHLLRVALGTRAVFIRIPISCIPEKSLVAFSSACILCSLHYDVLGCIDNLMHYLVGALWCIIGMLHFFCAALCKGEWMHCILMHYFCAAFCLCCIISYFRMLHNLLMHLHAFTCIVLRCINNAFMFCCIHMHSYAFIN